MLNDINVIPRQQFDVVPPTSKLSQNCISHACDILSELWNCSFMGHAMWGIKTNSIGMHARNPSRCTKKVSRTISKIVLDKFLHKQQNILKYYHNNFQDFIFTHIELFIIYMIVRTYNSYNEKLIFYIYKTALIIIPYLLFQL